MEILAPRHWEEPVRGGYIALDDFLRVTGLEILQGFNRRSRLPPPIHFLTGMQFEHATSGSATFTMPVTDWLLAPQGVVSGSALSFLVDGPLGCAVQTTLPAATPYTTSEMSLNFLRPVRNRGGLLTAVGSLVHAGRTVLLADARVTDDDGNLIALAGTRCVALPQLEVRAASSSPPPPPNEPAYESPHPFERTPVSGAVVPAETWKRLSGLAILRQCISGELPPPPISHLCGVMPTEADEGRTVWRMPASEWLCSPVRGRLYGGALAYLAGTALDGTYQSAARAGTAIAPVDLKVYFLRPVAPDGRDLVATGTLVHRGRTTAVATSQVHDQDGKLVATAIGSAHFLPGRPPSLATLEPGEQESGAG